ncbi:MAG: Ig-like domain-containing protein [Paracoccaceae bacterium]
MTEFTYLTSAPLTNRLAGFESDRFFQADPNRVFDLIDGVTELPGGDRGRVVVRPHNEDYALAEGALAMRFSADSVSGAQALFSKDSEGFDDGGHLTLRIVEGTLHLRAQTQTQSFDITGGKVNAGELTDVRVSWKEGRLSMYLNGTEVGSVDGWSGLAANSEPIVIGGSQVRSRDGVADNIVERFKGEIVVAELAEDPDHDFSTNRAPEAGSDSGYTLEAGQTLVLRNLLDNDVDPDGDELSIISIDLPQAGFAELNPDNTITYRAFAGYTGSDSFTYTVSDGNGGIDRARVFLNVTEPTVPTRTFDLLQEPVEFDGTNAVVLAHQDGFGIENGVLNLSFRADDVDDRQGLFSKDSSGFDDGGHMTLTIDQGRLILRVQTQTESLEISGGTIRSGEVADVSVTWEDGLISLSLNGERLGRTSTWTGLEPNREPIVIGGSQVRSGDGVADVIQDQFRGEITLAELIDLSAPDPFDNRAPEAEDDGPYTVKTGQGVIIRDLLDNDSDPDGNDLRILSVGPAQNGDTSFDTSGAVTYTADRGFIGTDTFTYTISDRNGGVSTASVTMNVIEVPKPTIVTELLERPAEFNGNNAVVVPHQEAFALDEGTLALRFRTDDVSGKQGLVSKDSSGLDDGGHLTLELRSGELFLRVQTKTGSLEIKGGRVDAGAVADVLIAWKDGNVSLSLDGAVVGRVTGWTGLGPNEEPIVIGGIQVYSGDRVADVIDDQFRGEIFLAELASVADYTPPGNTAPTVRDEGPFEVRTGESILIRDVLSNDSDLDGDSLDVSMIFGSDLATVELRDGKDILYTPFPGYAGRRDTIEYNVIDGQGGSSRGTVTVDILPSGESANPLDLGTVSAEMFAPFAEWVLDGVSVAGNEFDVDAKAVFTHVDTGQVREAGLFWNGDDFAFRFSGVLDGEWEFQTTSTIDALDGYFGRVGIAADPGARGFVVAEGTKFAQQLGDGGLDAILPNFAMVTTDIEEFYQNPGAVQELIDTFIHEHGFTGLHIPHLGNQIFDLFSETSNYGTRIPSTSNTPDPRTFEVLETIIQAAHEAGAVVHIWPWGDSARGQTPDQLPDGENGVEHHRVLEYFADRLGPLPGWTLGYGFDNNEWSSAAEAAEAAEHFRGRSDFDHLTSVRSDGPNDGRDHELDGEWHVGQDVADYEHYKPGYDVFVAAFENQTQRGISLDKPVLSGDRFRVRDGDGPQDWSEAETVDTLWISTIAGGAAGIYGNMIDLETGNESSRNGWEGSQPYSQATINQITTWNKFFVENDRFVLDMERANYLTGGERAEQYALLSEDTDLLVIYAEDTDTIELNLADLEADLGWSGSVRIRAVDTERAYIEVDAGIHDVDDFSLSMERVSDWALAVELL